MGYRPWPKNPSKHIASSAYIAAAGKGDELKKR